MEPAQLFWRFSLRVYRMPGVEQACLALQDRCDADVNLLLLCGWYGQDGGALDRRRLRQAMALVARWQQAVIAPLRGARREIKLQPPRGLAAARARLVRRRIGAIELELEAIEQGLLADLVSQWPASTRPKPARQAIGTSMERYLALLTEPLLPVDREHLAWLADACGTQGAGRSGRSYNKSWTAPDQRGGGSAARGRLGPSSAPAKTSR